MKYSLNNHLPCDGELLQIPNFINNPNELMLEILNEIQFRNDKIHMFGREMEQARKVAWYGDPEVTYIYSNIKLVANGWTQHLELMRDKICTDYGFSFNSVLVNYYRDGEDYMSYHSDDEKELGTNPIIFSLSLGASRDILFKHNESKEVIKLNLNSGDLLIMQGNIQHHWKHSIPKRKKVDQPRMNLTFRDIKTI